MKISKLKLIKTELIFFNFVSTEKSTRWLHQKTKIHLDFIYKLNTKAYQDFIYNVQIKAKKYPNLNLPTQLNRIDI